MADTNAKLEALGSAIREKIDDLADDPNSGGESPVKASGDSGDDAPEPSPPPAPAAPAPRPSAPAPKPAAAEPEVEQGPPSATGAQPAAAAPSPAAASPQQTEDQLLADYTRDEIDVLRKYAPGGKITSLEILKDARAKAARAYWETSRTLAEQAKQKEATPPAADAPPPAEATPPPELARFDAPIQAVVTKAKSAIKEIENSVANITGWKVERAKVLNEANALVARRNRGDSTVDPDEITAKFSRIHEIDSYVDGWQAKYTSGQEKYAELGEKHADLLARRSEVQLLLETRNRLDRQAQEEESKTETSRVQGYFQEWSGHLKDLAAQYKVPQHRLAKLEKDARAATYFAATEKEIEDTRAFLETFVKEFMDPVEAARQEGAIDYTKKKAADAPRVPAPGKPLVEEAPVSATLAPHDALRSLERRVMSDDAWEKMAPQ